MENPQNRRDEIVRLLRESIQSYVGLYHSPTVIEALRKQIELTLAQFPELKPTHFLTTPLPGVVLSNPEVVVVPDPVDGRKFSVRIDWDISLPAHAMN